MNPVAERKMLREMLRRIDSPVQPVLSSRWFMPLVWLVFVALVAATFVLGALLAPKVGSLVFVLLGMAYMYACLRASAANAWPALVPHLDRERIESRLRELGS